MLLVVDWQSRLCCGRELMEKTFALAVGSTKSSSGQILSALKNFGGQQRVLLQTEISRGARKLTQTLCDLDRKKKKGERLCMSKM